MQVFKILINQDDKLLYFQEVPCITYIHCGKCFLQTYKISIVEPFNKIREGGD